MSKENLEKFLKELAVNPALAERYKANPRAVMKEFGLAESDQSAILKGDAVAIQKTLGGTDAVPVLSIKDYKE